MSVDTVLLGLTALFTGVLAVRATRPVTKKRHFKSRMEQTTRSVWDMEFRRAQLKEMREDIRHQYDRTNENVQGAQARLETEKSKPKDQRDVKLMEQLENTVEKYGPDLEHLKTQLEGLSNEIENQDNPESLTQKIEALRTVNEMMERYRNDAV